MSNHNKSEVINCNDAEIVKTDDNIEDSVTKEVSENNEENKDIQKQLIINFLRQKFEYFSKHIGAYTALTTLFFAIITATGKFFRYVFETGRVKYLEIPKSSISIFNENIAYDIALTVVVGCIITVVIIAPYYIFKVRIKKIYKIGLFVFDFLAYSIVFLTLTQAIFYIKEYNKYQIIAQVIIFIFFYSITAILPSALFFWFTNSKKVQKKDKSGKLFVIVYSLICIAFLVLYVFSCGWTVEKEKTKYRVVYEQVENESLDSAEKEKTISYAIIYETDDFYYLAESEIEDSYINSIKYEHQKLISKDKAEYIWMSKRKK